MATPEGTERYFKRLAHKDLTPEAVRIFGKTGFKVSRIGFGGYRIHHNSTEHARALRYALLNGFNLIDTSSNYSDGGSEILIGNLLQEMFERQELSRDEVVVVSKVGYVQGQNMRLAQQAEEDGQPFPEMVRYADNCWHCLHPDFLEMQLSRTLERLALPALDVYLLHNPEYFLSHENKHKGGDIKAAHAEYDRRLQQAFEWMEEKVAQGKIKAYGVSSNTFVYPADDFEFTSLEKILHAAAQVASDNYFQTIQFPLNLFEIGACVEENQENGSKTLLHLAREAGLATLVSRPLNAMYNGELVRLASFRVTDPKAVIETFHTKLASLQRLENQFKRDIAGKLPAEARDTLQRVFSLASQFADALSLFHTWEHWDHVRQQMVMPQTAASLNYVSEKLHGEEACAKWAESYARAFMQILDAISKKYENEAQERTFKLAGKLKSLEPGLADSATLSQMALRVLTSVPEVNCVLLGMRKTPYVEDALAAMKAQTIEEAVDLLIDFNDVPK
ncbi:MAG: aldo/keto reductase [bacterium]